MCTYYCRGHWCGTTDVPPAPERENEEIPEGEHYVEPWYYDDDEEDTNL